MKTFNADGPWCPAAEVPSNAQGLQGFLPGLTSASGTSGPKGAGGGRPCWSTHGVGGGGCSENQATLPAPPGAAPGPAALGAPKVPALLLQEQRPVLPPSWRDAANYLHLRLISNKEESTKSWKNNLSLVNKRATTYSVQIKAQ